MPQSTSSGRCWTQPEHFVAWYGPNGAAIPTAEFDVRVGGGGRVCMEIHTPNGTMRLWFTGEHLGVIEGQRLTYTESMFVADWNVLAPSDLGMPDGHPTTTEVRIELDDLGGRTNMRMTHVGVPADSPGAAGWTMAFDKLAAYAQPNSESPVRRE